MNELILLKCGEIALKGLNRGTFEDRLIRNAKRVLYKVGPFKFFKAQSTIYAQPETDCDLDLAVERLSRVFGVAALCRARIAPKEFGAIREATADYLADALNAANTFKVTAKRSDKKFGMKSPQICADLGEYLLERFPHLKVDVNQPEVTVTVEIRDFAAYIHTDQVQGAGGIPVGSGGKAALLLSGGIDSPVAGYMMAKRGLGLIAVHFASPPYTSERALDKVKELAERMSLRCGPITLFVVPFTRIQEEIGRCCPEDYFTLVMRRFMMEIAERIALRDGCGALVTGESVGQVASQTLQSLACTEAVVGTLPVLRPVVGMDKEEIVAVARRIGTFETSIQPFEDCCTVFTPKHPRTRPKLEHFAQVEAKLDRETLIQDAVEHTTHTLIG